MTTLYHGNVNCKCYFVSDAKLDVMLFDNNVVYAVKTNPSTLKVDQSFGKLGVDAYRVDMIPTSSAEHIEIKKKILSIGEFTLFLMEDKDDLELHKFFFEDLSSAATIVIQKSFFRNNVPF